MTYIEKNKEEARQYRQMELIQRELKNALILTREEPGTSIKDVANAISKVYEPEEIEALKKLL